MSAPQASDNLRKLSGTERLGQNRESEYLGAEDIDPGKDAILTIAGAWHGLVTLQRGKENKDVITFVENSVPGIKNVRPLIVNSTNRKTLRKLFKNVQANTLMGKKIQLYVDHKVRDPVDGGLTDGVRIRSYPPKVDAPTIKCESCGNDIAAANNMSVEQLAAYTAKKYQKKLCADCATAIATGQAEPKLIEEGAKE